ncbi:MAG: N-acetyltransferase [Candidatus Hydrogenedentes bacterium]|nr:N-acetyltransferase [Candidatus Hydrogenedentota bacterium]
MSRATVTVRQAGAQDAAAIVRIYNHYIVHTAITFDVEPVTVESRRPWFSHFHDRGPHQLWVAVQGSAVLGYADSHPFREKAAYRPTVETSVYVDREYTRQGIGTLLYSVLFNAIVGEGVHRAIAGITLPNTASVSLHQKFGYRAVGTMSEIGFKFNRYWDVGWFERSF